MRKTILLVTMVLVMAACGGNTTERSPLHHEAATIQNIEVGARLCSYNLEFGLSEYKSGEVIATPYEVEIAPGYTATAIDIRNSDGRISQSFLGDMGIIPYANGWNKVNFTLMEDSRTLDGQGCVFPIQPTP